MTEVWVNIPTDQKDDYMPVVEPESWTLQDLIDLKERTYGRFNYELHASGKIATISYCNYKLGYNDTKVKENSETGAFITSHVTKEVVIQ